MLLLMALGFLIIGGAAGALVALAAVLTLGLGPVAALVVFWLGGLVATLGLASDFARRTTIAAVPDRPGGPGDDS
jgi:hypothetical protein